MGQAPSSPGRAIPYDHSYFSDKAARSLSSSAPTTPEHAAHTESTLTPSPQRTPLAIRRHEGLQKTTSHIHAGHNSLETGPVSYVRHRRESESTTSSTIPTTTSSALPPDTSIPTVTEFSDLDTLTDLELDFIQSTLDYPRIKTYSPGVSNMDVHVSRYDDRRKPGEYPQAYASSGAAAAAASGSKSPKHSKETKKFGGKKVDRKGKKVGRRTSETSSAISESSAQSSKAGGHAAKVKRVKSNEMSRRAVLAEDARKDSLANRWQHMVDEYQDVYMDHAAENKQRAPTNERKVGKISDYGKYDKVRQVFNRGYALPMQKAPPGLRVDELESESAPSDASVHSWNVMAPGRSLSMSSADHRTRDSASPIRLPSLSPDRRTSREVAARKSSAEQQFGLIPSHHNRQLEARRHAGVRSSELLHQSHMIRQEQSSTVSPLAARSSVDQHNTRKSSADQKSTRKQSTDQHSSHRKSSAVKRETKTTKSSSKKKEGAQDRATDIVDTVIENALRMLYGSPRSKRKSTSTSALSSTNVNNQNISRSVHDQDISRNVHNQNASRSVQNQNISRSVQNQNISRMYAKRHPEYHQVRGQSVSRNMHDRSISSGNLNDDDIVHRSASMADSSLYRTTHYGADWDQGHRKQSRSASHLAVEQSPRRPSQIRVVPGSGQRRQSSAVRSVQGTHQRKASVSPFSSSHGIHTGSNYSLDLQPYNAKLDQVSGTDYADRAPASFSDSDFATTTLEIRKTPESPSSFVDQSTTDSLTRVKTMYSASTPDPAKKSKEARGLPPTLTRGTVTRVLHDGGIVVPGATEFLAGLKSPQQSGAAADYASSKLWSVDDAIYPGNISLNNNPSTVYKPLLPTPTVTHVEPLQAKTTIPLYSASKSSQSATVSQDMYAYHKPSQKQMSILLDASRLEQSARKEEPLYVTSTLPNTSLSNSASSKMPPDLTPIVEVDETKYGVFSNEPIIVADLMQSASLPSPTHIQTDPGTKFYGTQPAINMSKRQQLNFYVFNQNPQPPSDRKEFSRQDVMTIDERYRMDPQSYRLPEQDYVDSSSDDTETEMRPVTIYHKQTQTPSISSPPSLPRRIRRDQKRSNKRTAPPAPVIAKPKPSHKETTHYITQQTEIEKLPPERAQLRETSVQTNFDRDFTDWSKPKQAKPRPITRTTSVENSSQSVSPVPRPVFTETREMEQYRQVRSPSPVSEPRGRDIPVIVLPKAEPSPRSPSPPPPPPLPPVPSQSNNREIVVGHVVPSSESSEEEILETMEIEEREQRIAMAIFEEVEFNVQRTQGGKTLKGSMNSTDIEPFWLPDKYEAIVDRRRQKMTQVKETAKEAQGSKRIEQGILPALVYSGETSANPKVLEDRTMTASKVSVVSDEAQNYKSDSGSSSDSETYKKTVEKSFSKTVPVITTNSVSDGTPRYRTSRTVFIDQSPTLSAKGSIHSSSGSKTNQDQEQDLGATQSSHTTVTSERSFSGTKKATPRSPETNQLDKFSFISGRQPSSGSREATRRTVTHSTTYPAAKSPNFMRVSKYDPDNVSFGKKSGKELLKDAEEVAFDLDEILESAERASQSGSVRDDGKVVSGATVLDGQVVHCSQSEPELKTRIEKDTDGNLVKITEMQHTLTKTVEYPSEGQPEVTVSETRETVAGSDKRDNHHVDGDADDESVTAATVTNSHPHQTAYSGPEVIGETSVGLKPYEYGTQKKTVKVQDIDSTPAQLQYLYDMNTAELAPVQTKDSKYNLLQYDTMFTQL